MKKRVTVIGLDGATWRVLAPLMKKGKLPFLSKLKSEGASGILKSTMPPLTAPAWTSLQTGTAPGKHGIFGFLNYWKDFANPPFYNSNDIKVEKLWDYFSRHNLKSLVINMPMTYPVYPIKGTLISSFLTPPGEIYCYPKNTESLLKKLKYKIDLFDGNKFGQLPKETNSRKQKDTILKELVHIAKARVKTLETLVKKGDYHFIFLLFKGTDIVQHLFWGEKLLVKYFQEIDRLLEKIYSGLGAGQPFIVVSDHGFYKMPNVQFSPYVWLENGSYIRTTLNSTNLVWSAGRFFNKGIKRFGVSITNNKLIKQKRDKVLTKNETKKFGQIYKKYGLRVTFEGIYFDKNDAGWRKNQTSIVGKLRNLKHEGRKVFQNVSLKHKVFKGGYVEQAPDIVWLPSKDFHINISPFAGQEFSAHPTHIKGDHAGDRDGIFIATGKNFKKSSGIKLSITDIFPMVCYLLNLEIPVNLDGKVPEKIIKNFRKTKMVNERQKVERQVEQEIKKLQIV